MATYDKNFDLDDIQALFLSQMIGITRFKTSEKTQKSESSVKRALGTMNLVNNLVNF